MSHKKNGYPLMNPVCITCRNYMPDVPPDGWGLGYPEECAEGLDMTLVKNEKDCDLFEYRKETT